jgi:hypothetical protein
LYHTGFRKGCKGFLRKNKTRMERKIRVDVEKTLWWFYREITVLNIILNGIMLYNEITG